MVPVEHRQEAEVAADLVRRIRAGDSSAEAEVFERYSQGLLALLRRRSGDPALAEDLHQETFRIVLVRLRRSGLGEPEKLAAFLHSTARNLLLAGYRKEARRRTETDAGINALAAAASQLDAVVQKERAALVRRLLADLEPARDREVLFRFYLAEQDKVRICSDLGLSHHHFKRVLYRARRRFRDLLESHGNRQRIEGLTGSGPARQQWKAEPSGSVSGQPTQEM